MSKNRADYGVVPVENSTEGVVTHTLDMFVDSNLRIVAQIVLPIQYCLAGGRAPEGRAAPLRASAGAGANAGIWVQRNLPKGGDFGNLLQRPFRRIGRLADKTRRRLRGKVAAITGLLAAEKYNLKIIERDIQDFSDNATRFLVLGRQCGPATGRDRTSVMFSIADEVGALLSRPRALPPLQVEHDQNRIPPQQAQGVGVFFFRRLRRPYDRPQSGQSHRRPDEVCNFVKVLGSYPNSD